MKKEYVVNEDGILIKDFLQKIGISRHLGRKIKLYGKMLINGSDALNYYPLKKGDILTIIYQETLNDDVKASVSDIDICYEDEYFLIVNKEENVAIQPSKKYYTNNLVSYVKGYLKGKHNPHLVNRLDYATSGLVILSKEGFVHSELKNSKIIKKYLCVVWGVFEEKEGIINLPIARCEDSIKRRVDAEGQKSITKYKVIKEFDKKSMLEITLITGRCHQIRVHMSYLNHPIVGDKLYGLDKEEKMLLHAYYLQFEHFLTKEKIEIIKYPKWY